MNNEKYIESIFRMKVSTNKRKIIHATSIYINGKGIVIFGKSGSGKSNLAIKLFI